MRSVISEHSTTQSVVTGIFVDEAMRTFFAEIKGLVNAAFHALHEEVQHMPGKDNNWRAAAMTKGLAFMGDHGNETTILNSVLESQGTCHTLTKQYLSAMHAFMHKMTTDKSDLINANFIPCGTFIARLYRKLSSVPDMREKYFTVMSYSEKDTLLCDVLRQVMHAAIIWPPSSRSMMAAHVPPSFTAPIAPNDSVSNISTSRPASVVAGSMVGRAVARSVLSSSRTAAPTQGSESTLSQTKRSNRQPSPNQSSSKHYRSNNRSSRFASTSITGPSKVVSIGQQQSTVSIAPTTSVHGTGHK